MTATRLLASAILLALVAPAQASYFNEVESNDTLAQAQSMDPYFSLNYDADIGDMYGNNTSTTALHASVLGTGNGTYDYYSFTLASAGTVILDIDNGMHDVDTQIGLWKADGTALYSNDDYWDLNAGAGGSIHGYDSFIQTTLQAGSYVIGVGRCCASAENGGWSPSAPLLSGADYTLHASVGAVPEAETYAMMLAGLGLVGFATRRRMRAAV